MSSGGKKQSKATGDAAAPLKRSKGSPSGSPRKLKDPYGEVAKQVEKLSRMILKPEGVAKKDVPAMLESFKDQLAEIIDLFAKCKDDEYRTLQEEHTAIVKELQSQVELKVRQAEELQRKSEEAIKQAAKKTDEANATLQIAQAETKKVKAKAAEVEKRNEELQKKAQGLANQTANLQKREDNLVHLELQAQESSSNLTDLKEQIKNLQVSSTDDGKPVDYDMTICLPLTDLTQRFPSEADPRGAWTLTLPKSTLDKMNAFGGIILGVLGEYSKGKTFFLRLLAGVGLGESGLDCHTDGLCFRFSEPDYGARKDHGWTEQNRVVILDTAGINSPFDPVLVAGLNLKAGDDYEREEMKAIMRVNEAQDNLYRDITLSLAAIPFVVVNQLTRPDVNMIMQITDARKKAQPEGLVTVVVHNLFNVKDPKVLLNIWKETCNLIGMDPSARYNINKELETEEDQYKKLLADITGEEIKPLYHTMKRNSHMPSRHIPLVFHSQAWGQRYNEAAIGMIRTWVQTQKDEVQVCTLSGDNLAPLEETLCDVISAASKRGTGLPNCKGVVFECVETDDDTQKYNITPVQDCTVDESFFQSADENRDAQKGDEEPPAYDASESASGRVMPITKESLISNPGAAYSGGNVQFDLLYRAFETQRKNPDGTTTPMFVIDLDLPGIKVKEFKKNSAIEQSNEEGKLFKIRGGPNGLRIPKDQGGYAPYPKPRIETSNNLRYGILKEDLRISLPISTKLKTRKFERWQPNPETKTLLSQTSGAAISADSATDNTSKFDIMCCEARLIRISMELEQEPLTDDDEDW